uniref:C3H1-type domain-containing protein n=1 Tax=Scylla olivacea TaxID=85551 RepID=A0A0P4WDE9_SCYOL
MGHRKNYGRNYFLTQSIQSHRNMSNGLGASPPSPSLRPLSHSSPVRQSSTRVPRRSLWGNGGNNCSRNEERPIVCGRNKHYKWPGNFGNSMKSLNCLSLSSNGVKSISSDSGSISSPNEGSCKDSSIGSSKKVSTPRLSNPLRYKTELCRSFEESGDCRFGEACTFAHGLRELRAVLRHPRYKTDLCRTYHGAGYCQYGARCHFVHDPEEATGVAALRGYKLRSQLGGLGRTVSAVSERPVNADNLIARNLQRLHAYRTAEERLSFLNSSDYGNEQLNSIGNLSPDFLSLNMLTIGQNSLSGLTSESHLQDNFFGTSDDLAESLSINYMNMKAPNKEGTEVGRYTLPCNGKWFDANSEIPTLCALTYLDAQHSPSRGGDIWRLGEASTQTKTIIGNPMEVSRSLQIPSITELIHMP